MRRLPGTALVAALAVLVSVVPARAERSGGQAAVPPAPQAPQAPSTPYAPGTAPAGRQAAFAAAARAYGVPESVLLGVSYLESRWDGHAGRPSVSAGYGPMHLVDGRAERGHPHGAGEDPRGDERRPRVIPIPPVTPSTPEDTLRRASELSGISPDRLRRDPAANIMGGAALLAAYQRATGGDPDAGPAGWYGAVARYSGPLGGTPDTRTPDTRTPDTRTPDGEAVLTEAARSFADEVYATIRAGVARVTDDGEPMVLPAKPGLAPRTPPVRTSPAPPATTPPARTPSPRTAQRRAPDPAPTGAPATARPATARPATVRPAAVRPAAVRSTGRPARPARPVAVRPPATARPPVTAGTAVVRPPAAVRPPVVRPPVAVRPTAARPPAARPPAAVPPIGPDCPRSVSCEWLPAVYQRLKGGGYGNHDRVEGGRQIDYIVIHDGETTYDAMTRLAKNPDYLSWHFTIRSRDGHIAQHLRGKDIGWHAGNWYVNSRSIGLEHEGYLARGGTWFTEAMYVASARLVRHLADKYDIPLDRAHILGHDNVPGTTPQTVSGMHDDPGPYWDWGHYFELLGSPLRASGGENARSVLIKPHYASNSPGFTGCPGGCRRLGAASVWLRTRPSPTAPLVRDVGKHPIGGSSYSVYDHAARASTGQRYALADRRDGWTAIWYLGQKAWFSDPAAAPTSLPASGPLVTPRPDRAPIKVYGRAYPGASAYPRGVPVQPLAPLQYSIPAGQVYSAAMTRRARYLRASSYDTSRHRVVVGKVRYRQIQFGHRVMFVRASDVQPVTAEDASRSDVMRASARRRR
ncbi:N-acetylmuramoyl-L-alanine amidase [Streptosporangium sp. NPDC050855]|uniref:N-acetylmuramoyl-L-alanine amidase n=1 Tax=Streptosporangium sp. NPDC050855 TaxID=3366194 RepID=UPI0037AD9BF2